MTDDQRILKINELSNEITPLHYERNLLSLKLSAKKEQYFKNFEDADRLQIIELENKIQEINSRLIPLSRERIELKCRYIIQYEGYIDLANPPYWEPVMEELFFDTDCQVDTRVEGWESLYTDNSLVKLFKEVQSFLKTCRYTTTRIVNIKRIR